MHAANDLAAVLWLTLFCICGAQRVIIVTSVPETPCSSVTGHHIHLMSLRNKQDYANLHGYEFHWTRTAHLAGPWNKVAVLLQLLQQHSTSQDPPWLLWVDADTLFANMSRTVSFARYAGKDVVIPGDEQALDDRDAQGINTGVMLVRATARAVSLFQHLAALGERMQSNTSTTTQVVWCSLVCS